MRVDYYRDGPRFVASLDKGEQGFFVYHEPELGSEAWRFVVPGSLEWDAIHQDIFFAFHDLDPCPPEQAASLPPLPPPPPFKWMEWKDNFPLGKPLLAKDFPRLRERLASTADRTARFWFLLREDRYETCLGDGLFLYFGGQVFESEEAARAFADSSNRESERQERERDTFGYLYTVKSFGLGLAEDMLLPSGYEPERHEDYGIKAVIARIEETLASEGALAWGTRED